MFFTFLQKSNIIIHILFFRFIHLFVYLSQWHCVGLIFNTTDEASWPNLQFRGIFTGFYLSLRLVGLEIFEGQSRRS